MKREGLREIERVKKHAEILSKRAFKTRSIIQELSWKIQLHSQGDQIGRTFALWVIVHFGSFFFAEVYM
jgi:hypothetical protein